MLALRAAANDVPSYAASTLDWGEAMARLPPPARPNLAGCGCRCVARTWPGTPLKVKAPATLEAGVKPVSRDLVGLPLARSVTWIWWKGQARRHV